MSSSSQCNALTPEQLASFEQNGFLAIDSLIPPEDLTDIEEEYAELLDSLLATPVIRCDEIAWSFAGLSMAGWNMLASMGITALAVITLTARHR